MAYDDEEEVEVKKSDDDDYVDPPIRHCYECGIIGYGCPCGNCGGSLGEDMGY